MSWREFQAQASSAPNPKIQSALELRKVLTVSAFSPHLAPVVGLLEVAVLQVDSSTKGLGTVIRQV